MIRASSVQFGEFILATIQIIPNTIRLNLSVLGGFQLEGPDSKPILVSNRKACGLLSYLALSSNRSETREKLAGLFWSDRSEEQARASLRQCLKQLRTLFAAIGFDGFQAGRQKITLSDGAVDTDLVRFTHELEQYEIPQQLLAVNVTPEKMLYGFEGLDQSFAAWLYVARRNWQDRLVDLLQTCMRGQSSETARHAAEALVNIDPIHEEANRHLIRQYALENNTASALKQYRILWDLLDSEFDMEPDDKTQALIAEIKAGTFNSHPPEADDLQGPGSLVQASSGPRSMMAPRSHAPVFGIWKFVHSGNESRSNYLVDGFRKELLAALIRFREWTTVEGEIFDLQGNERTNSKQAPVRNPDYQLEGAYYEEEGAVYLIITLKEVATQTYIWSEQLRLTLENWFATQRMIVRRIAIAFNVSLSTERLRQVADRSDMELAIYDRWLRGQALVLGFSADDWNQAFSTYQDIIAENDRFAPAYSSLAQLENTIHLSFPGKFRSLSSHQNALKLARRAVEIDPLDTRSHLCLAWGYAFNNMFDRAELSLELACSLNQNDPWTLVSGALGWAFSDNVSRALQLADQALALNITPSRVHWGYQGTLRFACADYEGCVNAMENAESAISNLLGWKAAALSKLGRADEAKKAATLFLAQVSKHWSGSEPPKPGEIATWFLHCFPIRSSQTWKNLCQGLMEAGVEVPDPSGPRPPI